MQQQGFSVLEILIALAIGVVVILTATRLLGVVAQSHQLERGQSISVEHGRIAVNLLERQLRNAGYPGCLPASRRNLLTDGALPHRPPVSAAGPWPEPMIGDGIAIRHMRSLGSAEITDTLASGPLISLDRDHGVAPDEIVLLVAESGNRCVLFRHADESITALNRGPGDESGTNRIPSSGYWPLQGRVEIFVPARTEFAVQPGAQTDDTPSLVRRRLHADGRREELVPGVRAMNVRFALADDTDGAILSFVPASQVADWSQVRAVRLEFLLGSDRTPEIWRPAQPLSVVIALRNIDS